MFHTHTSGWTFVQHCPNPQFCAAVWSVMFISAQVWSSGCCRSEVHLWGICLCPSQMDSESSVRPPHMSALMCVAEFRLLFPQLTGVLTLAFFIHNCIITLMKSNKHQENNVGLSVCLRRSRKTGGTLLLSYLCPPAFHASQSRCVVVFRCGTCL